MLLASPEISGHGTTVRQKLASIACQEGSVTQNFGIYILCISKVTPEFIYLQWPYRSRLRPVVPDWSSSSVQLSDYVSVLACR
jgi:hypothetical protein